MQIGFCRSRVAWHYIPHKVCSPCAGEKGCFVSHRVWRKPPRVTAILSRPVKVQLDHTFSPVRWQTIMHLFPFQCGEQARVCSGGTAAAQLLLRRGQLRLLHPSLAVSKQIGHLKPACSDTLILSLHLPLPFERANLRWMCHDRVSPTPVPEQTLNKANPSQRSHGKKMNTRVRGLVDAFVFFVCMVFMAGYFQGLFPDFLAVFTVLWALGCIWIPSSLETPLCGIEHLPVLHCQHPEGTVTLVMPALGARKGEKRGICLLQAKRLSPAPEKKKLSQ